MLRYQLIPVTHYQQNCSLIWCDETHQAAFIDPGGEPERLLAALNENNLTLTKILLTHGHLDHVGATAALLDKQSVPVIGPHKDDMFWIDILDQQANMMGFSPVQGFIPNQFLNQGDTVELGKETLEVRFCPGHTPGHIVFYSAAIETVWVGDVLFAGSIGRTDFPKGDFTTLANSIRHQLWTLPKDTTFVPGHGPKGQIGHEKQHNPFVSESKFG